MNTSTPLGPPADSQPDPLRELGAKALRRLARTYKIKNYQQKSPAALRRAIRRAQVRAQAELIQKHGPEAMVPEALLPPTAAKTASEPAPVQERDQQSEALKAYQEHRLRYLMSPSRFVHTGTHSEYLLEKDEELELPDTYAEAELVAMPVDPFQFYVYWDFDMPLRARVKRLVAEETPFLLRCYDVTDLLFDGKNAHYTWDEVCHPFIYEWYITPPISGRNLCIELGFLDARNRFVKLLRSNPVYIPPAQVSPVKHDQFAQFVPPVVTPPTLSVNDEISVSEAAIPDSGMAQQATPALSLPTLPPPRFDFIPPSPSLRDFFLQPFVLSPARFNPPPPPKQVLPPVTPSFDAEGELQPVSQAGPLPPPPPLPFTPAPAIRESVASAPPAWEWVQVAETVPAEPPEMTYLQQHGQRELARWFGEPIATEVIWSQEWPQDVSPILYEAWVTDPYEQSMLVSYSVWPWEWSEWVPMGSSDWLQRRFLGASVTSWYTPGGSERLVWRTRPIGASEQQQWLRPLGASEQPWSATWGRPLGASDALRWIPQPLGASEQSPWVLWPSQRSGEGVRV
jgi:hypothetical protein